MTEFPPLTSGQAAYHAHARAFLHPDQLQDHLLTEAWDALSPDDQQRWEAAGQAALSHLECRPLLEGPGARAPAKEVRAHLARAEQAWAAFVTGPDGQLDRGKVFAELADYSVVLDNTTQVYLHVTNRAASNPFIQADVIKALADGVTSDVASDEVADVLANLARSLDEKDHGEVLELIYRAATDYGVQDLPQRVEGQNAAAGQYLQACAARRAALTPEQQADADANEQLLGLIAQTMGRYPALPFVSVLEKLGVLDPGEHELRGLLVSESHEASGCTLRRARQRLNRENA